MLAVKAFSSNCYGLYSLLSNYSLIIDTDFNNLLTLIIHPSRGSAHCKSKMDFTIFIFVSVAFKGLCL